MDSVTPPHDLASRVAQLQVDLITVVGAVQDLQTRPQWASGIEYLIDKYLHTANLLKVAGTIVTLWAMLYAVIHGSPVSVPTP